MDLRIFTEPQNGASYETQLAIARAAEDHGFDAFFRSDHFLTMGGDGLPGPTDSWVTLGALARETTRIRLGTLVSSGTFRWPGLLAIQVAQVDAMSGGRIELGLGTGWFDAEHSAYGVPFPRSRERFDRLEEQLTIVSGLWSTPVGETFSYAGTHYTLTDSPALPKPVQQPAPPIIVGGVGPKRTPRLAAHYAAEYNATFTPLAYTREQFDRVRTACEQVSRDPSTMQLSMALTTCCGADEAEYARRAGVIGQDPEQLRQNQLGGTPQEIVDKLRAFADAGATRAYLQVLDMTDLDHIALLAAEVLPHVR